MLFSTGLVLLSGHPVVRGATGQNSAVPGFWGLAFKTMILLGFVIVLIYVVLFLLKRFVYRQHFIGSSDLIEVLNFMPLAAKKSLCVVKVVDRILVLGFSETGMTKLTEIEDPETQKRWLERFGRPAGRRSSSFATQLQNFLGQKKN